MDTQLFKWFNDDLFFSKLISMPKLTFFFAWCSSLGIPGCSVKIATYSSQKIISLLGLEYKVLEDSYRIIEKPVNLIDDFTWISSSKKKEKTNDIKWKKV